MIVGLFSRVINRWRPAAPIELPDAALPCRWGYVPLKPFIVLDIDPYAEAVLGASRTDKLTVACQQFAERLKVQPVANTHGVLDARGVVILGADPDPDTPYSGCAAAWLLMDRYLEPVDAAIYESMAREAAPV